MTTVIAAVMLLMAACQRKPVMAHGQFKHLPPAGWLKTMSLTFNPEFDDSTMICDLVLAVRHDNRYPFTNLSLVVDIIAADSTVSRHPVDLALADEYGNWSGGGFGSLYQDRVTITTGVTQADAHAVVVWQAMADCDTLCGVTDVGLITNPK